MHDHGSSRLRASLKSPLKYTNTSDKSGSGSLDHFVKQPKTVNYRRLVSFDAQRVCRRRKKSQRGSKHDVSASGDLERQESRRYMIPRFRRKKDMFRTAVVTPMQRSHGTQLLQGVPSPRLPRSLASDAIAVVG